MNLEPIDTSTTAGKAEVMRLAAEGRKVVEADLRPGSFSGEYTAWTESFGPVWDWNHCRYAIIAEPVGPDEVWCVYASDGLFSAGPYGDEQLAEDRASEFTHRSQVVRYIRADLVGEGK